MCCDDRLAQCKPKSQTASTVPLAFGGSIKHFKNLFLRFVRNARTAVRDFDHGHAVPAQRAHDDGGVCGRILERIVHQVGDDLHDEPRVHARHQQLVLLFKANAAVLRAKMRKRFGNDLAQQLRLKPQRKLPVLNARDGQ